MLELIETQKLHPHPDNPRKELGDLTELADSIKTNGIFQNLTVVPIADKKGEYTVIIGHRRLAAAKIAGLKQVPCVVVEMDAKKQLSTMLLENMQRSDLSLYEQAQGIQMVINLGESISDVAKSTGFSESTIRRRVKLLSLDSEKFKLSVARGATLQDYAELEKIKDLSVKNKVLDAIGTNNFNMELQRALNLQQQNENKKKIISVLKEFATEIKGSTSHLQYAEYYNLSSAKAKKPEDADKTKYFYKVEGSWIYLYKERSANQKVVNNEEQSEKDKQLQIRKAKLKAVTDEAYRLRYMFVKEFTQAKKDPTLIMKAAARRLIFNERYYDMDKEDFFDFIGLEAESGTELTFADCEKKYSHSPEYLLVASVYFSMDGADEDYYGWRCEYTENEILDGVYEFLKSLGYEMSDEEKKLQNGTHELFVKEG